MNIREVLDSLSKEELIDIVLELTEKDSTLKDSIIVRYTKGNDKQEINKCKKLIQSIVKKYTGRQHFIEYSNTYDFAREMDGILEKARVTKNALLTIDIAYLVLDEAIEAFQYADDSDGYIGGLVSETLEVIGETAINIEDTSLDLRKQILNKLLDKTNSDVFNGWEDYIIDILRICTEFSDIEEHRNKLRKQIEYLVSKFSNDERMSYSIERMLQILFEITDTYGTKEEAEQFIEDNLHYTSFREILIDKYAKENDYYKIIELTLEGEKLDREYAGLISKWKKIRYEAYRELSLKEEQNKLARELFLDGNFEYYDELKKLAIEDKESLYNNLKEELKKGNGWRSVDLYLKLIEEENDLDEIMNFVRKNHRSIETYAEKLAEKYKDEVIDIYKRYIKAEAGSASKRKHYQNVCEIFKRYKNIAGKNNQEQLINELTALYFNRPAFMDELSKVK